MNDPSGARSHWIRVAWLIVLIAWLAATVVRPAAYILAGFWIEEYRPFELMEAERGVLASGFLGVTLWSIAAAIYLRGRARTDPNH